MFKNILATFFLFLGCFGIAIAQDFSVVTTCGSGSVDFTVSSGSGPFNWDLGNGFFSTSANPTGVYNKPGNYSVSLTVSGGAFITKNIFVPAKPVFSYGTENVCMSTQLNASISGINPIPDFSALNGRYPLPPGLPSGSFNQTTGRITFNLNNINSGTYPISYSYTVPGCSVASTTATTTLGIGNANAGPFIADIQTDKCNQLSLKRNTFIPNPPKGAILWQISNATTGNTFVDLPDPDQNGASNSAEDYLTPSLTVTSTLRLQVFDLYCGNLDNSANDQLWTIAGLTKPGTVTSNVNTVCQNYYPVLTIAGYLGSVNWEYRSENTTFTGSSGTNAFVSQITPNTVGVTYNSIHTPSPSVINTTGNFYFRARVNYTQYGVLGNCETLYTNVVTVNSVFCTVTSSIVSTTLSPICLSQASLPGVFFSSLSTLTGSVASITGWRWSFGSASTPATLSTTTLSSPIVKYTSASTPIKNISLTVTGTGFMYVTTTTIQVDAFSNTAGIGPPTSNLTICSGNFVTLSVNSSNLNPVIQWRESNSSSITGFNNVTTPGFDQRVFTTPGLTNSLFYSASVTNGVCPTVTTPGRGITVIPLLTISPNLDQPVITICEGLNTTLTVLGINGDIIFQNATSITGTFTDVITGSYLSSGVYKTEDFPSSVTWYYRAQITNSYNCSTVTSGIYTVSVVSCPVLTNFTSSGALFNQRACLSNSNFMFTDITPTISGVVFKKWNWDFGSDASRPTLSTTVGNNISSGYLTEGIKTVNLTITAVAGIRTYTGINSLNITVDGISDASNVTGIPNPICVGTTTSITLSSTNANPTIQWQQSITGWNDIINATTTSYLTPALSTTTGYRVVVTNGVCTSATSNIVLITVLSTPVSSLLSANVLTVCSGGRRTLSISGANYSSIEWLTSTLAGFNNFTTVTSGVGYNSLVYTTDYLPLGDHFFIARLYGGATCPAELTGILTVSSVNCPILPVISVTSAYLPQRTCNDKPRFSFKDITPTISGVTFIQWDWAFDTESDVSVLTTTTGQPVIHINYNVLAPGFTNSIKTVRLTITGVTGNNTFQSIPATVVLTIDGIPSVTNFRSVDNKICVGNSNLILYDNYSPLGSTLNWYVSTTNGASSDLLSVSGSNYAQPTSVAGIFYYYVTADNGICPTYNSTTTSLVVTTITSQPVITAFNYPLSAYCNTVVTVSPNLLINGTFAGTTFSSNPLGLSISANGTINPGASTPNEIFPNTNYVVTYSIPSIGGCLSVSTTTSVTIGKDPTIPSFQYNLNPVCNNTNSIDPIPDASLMPDGAYTTTFTGFPLNATNGHINLTTINEGIYEIKYSTIAKEGCASKSKNYTVSVSGIPSTPEFGYGDGFFYCNNIGEIPLLTSAGINFTNPSEGYWTINPATTGMSVNTSTGGVIVSTLSGGGAYFITYYKNTTGGCSAYSVFNNSPVIIYLAELAETPYIDYGSSYCTNTTNILPLSVSTFSGGSFNSISSVIKFNNIITGDLQVKEENLTFTGIVEVNYTISNYSINNVCPNVIASSLVTFTGIPAPVIHYDKTLTCNDPVALLYPIGGVYTVNGFYRARNVFSNPLDIDAQTGVVTVTSATIQDLYTIDYIVTISGCSISSVTSPGVSISIQDKPDPPVFDYTNEPICQQNYILVNKSNLVRQQFSTYPASLIVDNDGNLYTYNTPDGIYTITGSNYSIPIFIGSVATTTCAPTSSIDVVTIGSQIVIPDFSYGSTGFFCSDGGLANPSVTLTGGIFSSNKPGLLSFNTITGVVNLANSVPTSYEITYSIEAVNSCTVDPKKTNVTINRLPSKQNFSYGQSEYCQGGGLGGLPQTAGLPALPTGGYYSISPQTNALNTFSGFIDLAAIDAGPKEIVYISPGQNACPNVSSDVVNIMINPLPQVPVVNYGPVPICINEAKTVRPAIAFNVNSGATFSGPAFLNPDGSLSLTDLSKGQFSVYSITVKNPDAGNCLGLTGAYTLTISSPVNTPQFDYTGSPFCRSGEKIPQAIGLIENGYFSASSNIVFKDPSLGSINLAKSIPGRYDISYVVPSINGCDAFTTLPDTISIVSATIGVLSSEAAKGSICGGNGVDIDISDYTGSLAWQKRNYNDSIWGNAQGTFENNRFTSEPLNDSTYFRAKASFSNCPDSVYSNEIKIRVRPGSFGGTATSDDNTNFREICNELQTILKVKENIGSIMWEFSKDSLYWEEVSIGDTIAQLKTPGQNEYGLKIWYRVRATNGVCPPDYSNRVLVKVCDKTDFIPNALTPNSNDNNSYWLLDQLKLRDFAEVKIYNRYGSLVYSANGRQASDNPWDGGGLPTGTYYYVIDRKDQTKVLTGSISVIK